MEKIKLNKNWKEYGVKTDEEYIVKRNINNECVIIVPNKLNIIANENEARKYGIITGTPQLCFS